MALPLECLRFLKYGDTLKLRSDLSRITNALCGVTSDMKRFEGNIVTVNRIINEVKGVIEIVEDGRRWNWSLDLFEDIVSDKCEPLLEDEELKKELSVGDLVKIRDFEELKKYYKYDEKLCGLRTECFFDFTMKKFCNMKAIVVRISGKFINLKIKGLKGSEYRNYSFSRDMLEIVEKNYTEKHKGEKNIKMDTENQDEIIKEMISKVDKAKIVKILASAYRKKGTSLKGVDKMLEEWAKSKKELYLLFGKKLKLEKEIEYVADENFWQEMIESFCREFPQYYHIFKTLGLSCYKDNVYRVFSSELNKYTPELKEGMKLSTFFSKLFKNEEFDLEFSKVIDSAKIKGNIVVSIDPIDFILMSYNQSGWSSCHSIAKCGESLHFGEYVAGIFSYIGDNCTAIAYRHSDKLFEYRLGSSKFNEYSKNWRQLMYIDTKNYNFFASRQYPRYDETISKEARNLIETRISEVLGISNVWKKNDTKSSNYNSSLSCLDDNCCLHYNDILNDFDAWFLYNKELDNDKSNIYVGCDPICPICGVDYIEESHKPCCNDCYAQITGGEDD